MSEPDGIAPVRCSRRQGSHSLVRRSNERSAYIRQRTGGLLLPFGYNSFHCNVTSLLNKDGKNNTLAVRLENRPQSSRWYPGAGLYRNVHLVINEDAHIPTWGTYATTPVVTDKYAKVSLKTSLVSPEGANKDNYRIVTQIKDKNGKVVATGENKLSVFDNTLFEQEFAVANPELWSPDTPVLYTAESKVYEGNTLKDEYTTRFGIRTWRLFPARAFPEWKADQIQRGM